MQRKGKHRQLQCAAKAEGAGKSWLTVGIGETEYLPPSAPGASAERGGLMRAMDHGTIHYGAQRGNMKEYFISDSKHMNGRWVLRALAIGGKQAWYFVFPKEQNPLKPWEHGDTGEVTIRIAEKLPGLEEENSEGKLRDEAST